MERLTREKRGKVCDGGRHPTRYTSDHTTQEVVARLAAYEDTGLTPEGVKNLQADYIEIANRKYGPLHHKIAEWVKADEDGRLVVLPCKVGDIVLVKSDDDGIYDARVQGISISATGTDTIIHFGGYPIVNAWGSGRGKTWFLTRQEAEAAVREEDEHGCEYIDPHLRVDEAMVEIMKLPTADVAPVRHGRWLRKPTEVIAVDVEECSICGCLMNERNQFWDAKYCPNCGAKMDGKDVK